MSVILEKLAGLLSTTTAPLSTTLPLTPLIPTRELVKHVTTGLLSPKSPAYLLFSVLHGARVATFWTGLTKNKPDRTRLADLLGYFMLAWGGPTTASFIIGTTPSWLISPTPWLLYVPVYFLVRVTGLTASIVDRPLPNLISAFIDGFTRSTTIVTLPALIARDAPALAGNVRASSLLGGIAISAGGWIVDGFSLTEPTWRLQRLTALSGWPLDSMEFWASALTGALYSFLRPSSYSKDVVSRHPAVNEETARLLCAGFFGTLLASRVVLRLILNHQDASNGDNIRKVEGKVDNKDL